MSWFRGWAVVTPRGTIVIDTVTKIRKELPHEAHFDLGDKACKVAVVELENFVGLLDAALGLLQLPGDVGRQIALEDAITKVRNRVPLRNDGDRR